MLVRHAAVIALALVMSMGALRAQDAPRPFAPIPKGEREARYTEQGQIPPQLLAAIKATACVLDPWLPEAPVHVFQIEKSGSRRTVALATCGHIIARGTAFVFDNPLQPPRQMPFPIIDAYGGIGMTYSPGYLTWDEKEQILRARLSSDMCPGPALRYTYRFEPQADQDRPLSWALLKAEVDRISNGCDGLPDEWETFWEAPTPLNELKPR